MGFKNKNRNEIENIKDSMAPRLDYPDEWSWSNVIFDYI